MEFVWISWPIGESVTGIVSSSRNTDGMQVSPLRMLVPDCRPCFQFITDQFHTSTALKYVWRYFRPARKYLTPTSSRQITHGHLDKQNCIINIFCIWNLPFYGKYDDEPGWHESKHVGGVHKGLTRTIVILQRQPGAWNKEALINHPAGTSLTSDWSVNSFIMVVCKNVFLVVLWTESSDWNKKQTIIDNHYKTIPRSCSEKWVLFMQRVNTHLKR